MGIITATGFKCVCDSCGAELERVGYGHGDSYTGETVFSSIDEVRLALDMRDWLSTDSGNRYCYDCRQKMVSPHINN